MTFLVCVVILSSLLVISAVHEPFSNSVAVKINGDAKTADQLASRYNFINRGLVGNLDGVFHFESVDGLQHLKEKIEALRNEPGVLWVELQKYRAMVPKERLPSYHHF